MSIDHDPAVPGSPQTTPAVPHTLMGMAGEDSIALSWEQDGEVDSWTVYIDPLDGTPSQVHRTTRARFEITDLPPGDHEVGVVSWRDGVPCPGSGVFLMVSVLGPPPLDAPAQPQDLDVAETATGVDASWDSGDASGWDARLICPDWTVEQRVDGLPSPRVSFSQLSQGVVYGVQVRARGRDGMASRWSVPAWVRTRTNTCGHGAAVCTSSVRG